MILSLFYLKKMEEKSEFEYTVKLIILGDSCVGKSNIILRYIDNKFCEMYLLTQGMDVQNTTINLKGRKIRVQLWDTAGQEKYKSMTRNLLVKVQGFLLVYDITNKESFNNLGSWIKTIRDECGAPVPIIIVGNKTDLEDKRSISKNQAMEFARSEKVEYLETSSKTGENITKAINMLVVKVLDSATFTNDSSFALDDSSAINIKKRHKCCSK